MSKIITVIAIAIVSTFFMGCTKDKIDKNISYPDSIYFGKNILNMPDSSVLKVNYYYGFGADLGNDAKLSIIITNYSTEKDSFLNILPVWYWVLGKTPGWVISNYDISLNRQKFTSTQSGKIDAQMKFDSFGKHGICKVEYYENSETITKTKYFFWQ
jgi:hypothetical protein